MRVPITKVIGSLQNGLSPANGKAVARLALVRRAARGDVCLRASTSHILIPKFSLPALALLFEQTFSFMVELGNGRRRLKWRRRE